MQEPSLGNYKIGHTASGGQTIKFIYGQSKKAIVFEDEEGRVQWESATDTLSPTDVQVHNTFDRLHGSIRSAISRSKRQMLTEELAQALFRGLSEPVPQKALSHFDDVARRITQEALVRARVSYVAFGSLAMLVIAAGCLIVGYYSPNANISKVLVGGAAGTVGAWTSVLERASKLKVGPFDPPLYVVFQGITRTLLGGVFGAFLVVASNAGLVLTLVRDNVWGITFSSFIAGISERYVPEMLREYEKEILREMENQRPRGV